MGCQPIVVAGGGPAGMMAAIVAASAGQPVILLERNPVLGKKLLLTGKGRCNLTNDASLNDFLPRFSDKQGLFLRDAFKVFFNKELKAFFETRGLALKSERQERVFPVSDRAASVRDLLKKELRSRGVVVVLNQRASQLLIEQGKVSGVKAGNTVFPAGAVVLAVGGKSYPFTGSDGRGYALAKKAGHTIVPLRPGLVSLKTSGGLARAMEGVTLKNIVLTLRAGRRKVVSGVGELLFTAQGISGPLVFSLSGVAVDGLAAGQPVTVEIDFKPAISRADLELRLQRDLTMNPRQTVKNLLKGYLPLRVGEAILESLQVDLYLVNNQATASCRRDLLAALKGLTLTVRGHEGFSKAMVTRGGVALKEVDPRTMASRQVRGLFFAGEMLDIDGDTGGFNLQAAFSSGHVAGCSAARHAKSQDEHEQ